MSVFFTFDENHWSALSDQISFSPNNFHLVLHGDHHPLLEVYIIKLSTLIFNKHLMFVLPPEIAERASYRLLQVLLCSCTILVIYFLAHDTLGRPAALFAAFLMAVSQFHIHLSRTIVQIGPLLLFASLSLLFFWKSLKDDRYTLLTGLATGLAYLCEESAVFLPAIFFIYLLLTQRLHRWMRQWQTYAAMAIFVVVILPDLYWNLISNGSNIVLHLNKATHFHGISLLSTSLYVGELFTWFASDIEALVGGIGKNHIWPLEYPPMHWALGILCLIAVIVSFRERHNEFVKLMLTTFLFIFVFFTIFASSGPLGNFSYYWASISTIPAITLAGGFLARMLGGGRRLRWVAVVACVYLVGSAVAFLSIRDQMYVRRPELLEKFYTNLAHDNMLRGNYAWSVDNLQKALRYAPESKVARANLIEAYSRNAGGLPASGKGGGRLEQSDEKYLFDRGYVKQWMVADMSTAAKVGNYEDMVGIDMDRSENARRFREVKSETAVVDLKKLVNPATGCTAYACAEIYSPETRKVIVWLMVDDGAVVWLNGERIYGNEKGKYLWIADQDRVDGVLNKGWNRMELKVFFQGGAYFGYAVRITDTNGNLMGDLINRAGAGRDSRESEIR